MKRGTPEDPAVLKARVARDLECLDESLTRQSFATEVDVNVIMERAIRNGGELPRSEREAFFGDVSNVGDFHQVQERLRTARQDARALFEKLPPAVRKEFDEDPEVFASWASEQASDEEVRAVAKSVESAGAAVQRPEARDSSEVMKDGSGPGKVSAGDRVDDRGERVRPGATPEGSPNLGRPGGQPGEEVK